MSRFQIATPLAFSVGIFVACLLGIYTRPVGFLATVWPANALMLGLLIRMPRAAGPLGWLGAGVAYMAADLLTGSSLAKAVILNAANLAGVAAGYVVFTRLSVETRLLRQPASMLHLVAASAAAGATAGIVGGIANPLLFNGGIISGWTFWFATEFVNYMAILPVVMSAPSNIVGICRDAQLRWPSQYSDAVPVAALAVACGAAVVIGGPGALSFPVPALLWCGLVYSVFPTAVLTLFFGVWTLVIISAGYVTHPDQAYDEMTLISVRLGVSLIALTPVMLSIMMQSRNELLAELRHLALHDPLTGVNNRNAFRASCDRLLASTNGPCTLMMIDLDHFKAVNDRFGHAAGDAVLVTFADRMRRCVREGDVVGRLGGEEFAVMAAECASSDAMTIVGRIRAATHEPVLLPGGISLVVTASIGMVIVDNDHNLTTDGLLSDADDLLYRAKANGRDRIETVH